MYLIRFHQPEPDDRLDPETMHRRALLAAALSIGSVAALPAWAEAAARTADPDHTRYTGTWHDCYTGVRHELDTLARLYVTGPGMTRHSEIRDSGLWLYAQAVDIANSAPLGMKGEARRLCAETAAFAAGAFVDFGHMSAATELYSAAHLACGTGNADLRAFVNCQANWVAMYSGRWHTVMRRSETAVLEAERHGGPALLMAYMHRAHAHAAFGNKNAARQDLATAQANIARVPGSDAPHHALTYNATKVWFSSANAYAALGDRGPQADAQDRALQDPTLGWMDRQLMSIGKAVLEPDAELAAHRIRFQLISIPADGFAHCVKADAEKALARLKARQLTRSTNGKAGAEVRALGTYLSHVQVA